jgi:lysophospholipase L1-like esterase
LWSQVSGPNTATIRTPSANTTEIAGLVTGTYYFQFVVTNDAAAVARDTMVVNVSSSSYTRPTIVVGQNTSNITLPVDSFNVTSSVTYNFASQSSFNWKKLFVPGQAAKRVALIGSSTIAGYGATSNDSAWAGGSLLGGGSTNNGLFFAWAKPLGLVDSIFNFGVPGTNPYQGMPDGYVPNATVQGQLSPSDSPKVASNISAALRKHPDILIVNFPTNGFDVLSYPNIKIPFQKFADTCTSLGIAYYFTTTQPRSDSAGGNFYLQSVQDKLKSLNDSLKSWFPGHIIEFYLNTTITGTTQKLPQYDYGDKIHFNNAGHRALFEQVKGVSMFNPTSASTIASATSNNTKISGLTAGTHRFIAIAQDTHAQDASGVVSIAVNSGVSTANAGPDRTITLPTNSTTADGTGSSGNSTWTWSQISGPNTANIVSPSFSTTTISGLIEGVYKIKLTVNGGSADTMQITVLPVPPPPPCGSHAKYTKTPDPTDSSLFDWNGPYLPGDTIVLNGAFSSVDFGEVHGSAGCPVTIINSSSSVTFIQSEMTIENCTNIHLTGTGKSGTVYGIFEQHDPQIRYQWRRAISIQGKSSKIEIDHFYAHNVDIGIVAEEDPGCDTTSNYPNWIMDSILIHDCRIVGTWNEGMYIGNTSPDNASYDLRPVYCGADTLYPAPAKNGWVHIYNNWVDSTGRGGIQVSNAEGGFLIEGNTVKHSGLNGDDAQGTGITLGLYGYGTVKNNTVSNTYTWAIASVGAGMTGKPIYYTGNTVDSSGYLNVYNLATTSRESYDPRTEPTVPALALSWPQSLFIDSRPHLYTTDTPHPGTGVLGQDSTQFNIQNNIIGIQKSLIGVRIEDNYTGVQRSGNYICNNTQLNSGIPATISTQSGINYSISCNVGPCPDCVPHKKSKFIYWK